MSTISVWDAPSGECVRGRGRYGVICRYHCVIRTLAPSVLGTTIKALYKFTSFTSLLFQCYNAVVWVI